jgi:hypothetical protein
MSVDQQELQRRWRTLVRHYPVWRMFIDLTFDPGSWRLVGSDLVSLIVQSKNARKAARALDGASLEMLNALSGMANVNERRATDIFRAVFLGYVSVPIALAAMLSDASPDLLRELLTEMTPGLIIFLIGTLVFPIVYFCGSWRAKQIAWVVDLYRAGALAPLPETERERNNQSRRQAGAV